MTDAEVKAISEVLSYIAKLVVDIRADTKAMRDAETRSRSSVSQELRRLRSQVAKLRADRTAYRKVSDALRRIVEDQQSSVRETNNVKKKFNWNSK